MGEESNGQWLLRNFHIIPIGDLREHCESPDCWCVPTQDDEEPQLYIHRSMDKREHYETGELKPN